MLVRGEEWEEVSAMMMMMRRYYLTVVEFIVAENAPLGLVK